MKATGKRQLSELAALNFKLQSDKTSLLDANDRYLLRLSELAYENALLNSKLQKLLSAKKKNLDTTSLAGDNCLTGVFIDQLTSYLTSDNNFLSNDILMLSEPVLKHQRNPTEYISKQVTFDMLSAKLVADINSLLNFGSMAYVASSDYAPIGHQHEGTYNKVAISCVLSAALSNDHIATFNVDGDKYELYAPKPTIRQLPAPEVGQLKLIYQTAKQVIDVNSDNFDGWVYADGSTYSASMFDVKDAFDVNEDGTFTVPNLNNFIKLNPKPYQANDISEKYEHVDPYHTHDITMSLSGNVKGSLKYNHTSSFGGIPWSHGVDYKTGTCVFQIELDYSSLKISSKDYIEQSQQVGEETYPTYNSIPVMVYIGMPKGEEHHE